MATSTVSIPAQPTDLARSLKLAKLPMATLLTIGLATLLNVALFFVFSALGLITQSVEIQTFGGPMPLNAVMVASNTIIQMLLGVAVLAGIIRFRPSGAERIWRVVAAVALVLSFAVPFTGIPGAPIGYHLALEAMHVVSGALAIWTLPALSRAI